MERLRSYLVEKWVFAAASVLSSLLVGIQIWWMNPDPHFERSLDAVVIVQTPTGSGTGFFISKDGCLLTAAHVIEDALQKKQPIVILPRGTSRRVPARVVGFNPFADTAALCADTTPPAWLKIVDTENIRQGDRVYAVGHPPGGRNWNLTEGVISRYGYKMHKITKKVWVPRYDIWTSAFISWGNSGGPLIDRYGNVVGMIVEWDGSEIGVPNNSNVAVPGTDLRRFLKTIWGKL